MRLRIPDTSVLKPLDLVTLRELDSVIRDLAPADGGLTCPSNLVLLCSRHHRSVHEGQLFVEIRDDKIVFHDAHGLERPTAPPSAATGEELEALERFLRNADLHIDPSVNEPLWDGTPLDTGDALAWLSVADQTRTAAPG